MKKAIETRIGHWKKHLDLCQFIRVHGILHRKMASSNGMLLVFDTSLSLPKSSKHKIGDKNSHALEFLLHIISHNFYSLNHNKGYPSAELFYVLNHQLFSRMKTMKIISRAEITREAYLYPHVWCQGTHFPWNRPEII